MAERKAYRSRFRQLVMREDFPWAALTPREREYAELRRAGLKKEEACRMMGITWRAAWQHQVHIEQKAGARPEGGKRRAEAL